CSDAPPSDGTPDDERPEESLDPPPKKKVNFPYVHNTLDTFIRKIDSSLNSPYLTPNDFHLFLKLRKFLGGKRFVSDEELENAVSTWLNELAAEKYHMGVRKLVNRYGKCLNVGGDYVEK
ncbi:hypothetical protein AVEN_160010-1, partial [Araneus ventricosus]